MELKRRRVLVDPYDIWQAQQDAKRASKGKKLHPSSKRTKKNNIPHPGQSYNPHPADHDRLLKKVAQKEMEYRKKETTIRRALKVKVDQKELRRHEKEQLVSGIEHLIEPQDKTAGDSSDSSDYSDYDEKDFEAILKDKAVCERRKTRRQRSGQLKDRLQRRAAKLRKLKNIRLAQIDGVKKLTKELDRRDKELASRKKRHRAIKNERLGQKFEPSDPIYCLTSELPKNLRETTCPMDAIVRDQLESFQSRLMVEPSRPQVRKSKYKRKQFDRRCAEEQEG